MFKENNAMKIESDFPSLLTAKLNELRCFLWQVMEHKTQTALRKTLVYSHCGKVQK